MSGEPSSQSIQAALSVDGKLVVVAVPSLTASNRGVLQVYQAENGLLQTTLTSKENTTIQKLLFHGNHQVVASCHEVVLIWDLARGGVVAHTISGGDGEKIFLDAASHGDSLFVFVAVAADGEYKLQIHQYDPTSGRLLRKIKCGKAQLDPSNVTANEFGMTVDSSNEDKVYILIRNSNSKHSSEAFRILDVETGSKVSKHKYSKKQGSGGQGIFVQDSLVAIPRVSTVALFDLKAKQWLSSIPTNTQNPQVRFYSSNSDDNDSPLMLVVDQYLYHFSKKKLDVKSKLSCTYNMAVLPRSLHQLLAVVHNPASPSSRLQIQIMEWNDQDIPSEMNVKWTADKKRESTLATVKKRQAENITILGPGQAGEENMAITEHKAKKRARDNVENENEEDEDNVDDVEEHSDEEDPAMGMSIAERLKKLTEVIDDEDDEISSDADDELTLNPKNKFLVKRATTESLTQLLTQALEGGDDGLLELALAVKDANVVEKSIYGLEPSCMDVLVTKLTTRLASKPQRAEELAFWLSIVLKSGRIQTLSQVQPLKNLLQERIEAFPHLLRLEGRLAMINNNSNVRTSSSAGN